MPGIATTVAVLALIVWRSLGDARRLAVAPVSSSGVAAADAGGFPGADWSTAPGLLEPGSTPPPPLQQGLGPPGYTPPPAGTGAPVQAPVQAPAPVQQAPVQQAPVQQAPVQPVPTGWSTGSQPPSTGGGPPGTPGGGYVSPYPILHPPRTFEGPRSGPVTPPSSYNGVRPGPQLE